jgi:hypothetical protein
VQYQNDYYEERFCVPWVDIEHNYIYGHCFLKKPGRQFRTVKQDGFLLVPQMDYALYAEVPQSIPVTTSRDKKPAIIPNVNLIIVNPDSIVNELEGLNQDDILNISDGYWNVSFHSGVIHPEGNVGYSKATNLPFSHVNFRRFVKTLWVRGPLCKFRKNKSNNLHAYFAGSVDSIVARTSLYKVMNG